MWAPLCYLNSTVVLTFFNNIELPNITVWNVLLWLISSVLILVENWQQCQKKSRVRLNVIIRRVFFKLFLHTDFSCITERNVTSFAVCVYFLFCLCYTFAVCIARRHRPCWTTPPWRLQGSEHSGNWGKSRVILQVKAKKLATLPRLTGLFQG